MFCIHCGAQIPDDAQFCFKCGGSISNKNESQISKQTNEASREEVIIYLRYAADLEKSLFTYQNLWNKIQKKIDSLGHPAKIHIPSIKSIIFFGFLTFGPIFILLCFFPMIQYGIIGWVIFLIIALLNLCLIIPFSSALTNTIRTIKSNKELIEIDNARVEHEKQIIMQLKNQQKEISSIYNETDRLLKQMYSLDIIYPKYHNMAAVNTILEYLQSGRCSRLTGPDGAYNLFSFEEKQNIIINKLDQVLNKLEQIKNTQYMLYNAIQNSNSLLNRIWDQNEEIIRTNRQIAQNSELIAYNTERISTNATITAYIETARAFHGY